MCQVSAEWVIEDEPEKRLERSKASAMQTFTSKPATSGKKKVLKPTSRLSAAVPEIAKKSTKRPSDVEMFCSYHRCAINYRIKQKPLASTATTFYC